jgi:uncharacterized protein YggE
MHTTIKNLIGIAATITLIILAWALQSVAGSYAANIQPDSFRSFTVSGTGEVVAIPDVAQFTYSIISEGGIDLSTTQADAVAKANAIKTFVKGEGVEKEDIKDTQYSVEPRYQYYQCNRYGAYDEDVAPCPPPEIVGYTVRQTTQVKVRDFAKVGALLGGVVEKGANNVSQLQFTIDDPTQVQNEAREEAIRKAQDKAKSIAKAGGFSVGKLLSISEGSNNNYYKRDYAFAEMAMADGVGGAAPMIEPGSQDVSVNVTLTYEIR